MKCPHCKKETGYTTDDIVENKIKLRGKLNDAYSRLNELRMSESVVEDEIANISRKIAEIDKVCFKCSEARNKGDKECVCAK